MASHTCKHTSHKRKSKSVRRRVTYSPSSTDVPTLSVSLSTINSEPVNKPKPVIENKILYYLRRLRERYWKPVPQMNSTYIPSPAMKHKETGKERFLRYNSDTRKDRVNRNVMKPMVPRPGRYSSQNQYCIERRSDTVNPRLPFIQEFANSCCKAQDIVSAAIEYGLANGIVSKNGKYFWISEGKLTERSVTPGLALRKNRHGRSSYNHDSHNIKNRHISNIDAYISPDKQLPPLTQKSSVKHGKSNSRSHSPAKVSSVSKIFPKGSDERKSHPKSRLIKKSTKHSKLHKNTKNMGDRKKVNNSPRHTSLSSDESASSFTDSDITRPSPRKKRKKSPQGKLKDGSY